MGLCPQGFQDEGPFRYSNFCIYNPDTGGQGRRFSVVNLFQTAWWKVLGCGQSIEKLFADTQQEHF